MFSNCKSAGTGVYGVYNFTVMCENIPVAKVFVSDDRKEIKIEKLVADSIRQPFGGDDVSVERVYGFLKSRCYEDGRADLEEILLQAHLETNDPWKWNKITHGVMWEDQIWIRFEGEDLCWEDVRWRK